MREHISPTPFRFSTEFEVRPIIPDIEIDEDLSAAVLRAELASLRKQQAEAIAAARAETARETEARVRAERDEALLAAIDALHAAWEDCAEERAAGIEAVQADAAQLALAVGEALAGHALATAPTDAIDAAIGRILSLIARGQEVTITVNPALIADVEARVADRQSRDRRRLNLIIEGDPALATGDACLVWDGGGQTLNRAARRQAVVDELAAILEGGSGPLSDTH